MKPYIKRYQYLSMIVEQAAKRRFYVIDWDYESEEVAAGPFATEREAERYIERREFGG